MGNSGILAKIFSLFTYLPAFKFLLSPNHAGHFRSASSRSGAMKVYHFLAVNSFLIVISHYIRLYRFLNKPQNVVNLMLELMWTSGYTSSFLAYIHILYFRNELCNFLNMLLQFERGIDGKIIKLCVIIFISLRTLFLQ